MPGAIASGTPMSDVTKVGDTFYTNEMVDNVLVSRDGFCDAAAKVYANGHDMKDPLLSPVYGDYEGFAPTILTSGTRDLLLSNTVRVHRKLRDAGIESFLQVFEGQSHAHYLRDATAPETKATFKEISGFFDKHMGEVDGYAVPASAAGPNALRAKPHAHPDRDRNAGAVDKQRQADRGKHRSRASR